MRGALDRGPVQWILGLALVHVVMFLGVVAGTAPLAAQFPGSPSNEPATEIAHLDARIAPGTGGAFSLRLLVPEGWSLYTQNPGSLGLPLEVAWTLDGERMEPEVRWPDGVAYETPTGAARVWREPVAGLVTPGPPVTEARSGAVLAARIRWALCRADLCVPGWSRVEFRLP